MKLAPELIGDLYRRHEFEFSKIVRSAWPDRVCQLGNVSLQYSLYSRIEIGGILPGNGT
jgi:hypothetical protein